MSFANIYNIPFNSRAPVVTEYIVKIAKSPILKVYHFSNSQFFLVVKP